MDSIRVKMIHDFSISEHWPFTRLVRELKSSGVALLRLNLVTGDREFLDSQGTSCFEASRAPTLRTVAPAIDAGRISLEFRRFLYCNTTLPDMLAVLATAGVQFFEVDLLEGSCSFHGHARHLPGLAVLHPGIPPGSGRPPEPSARGGVPPGIEEAGPEIRP